MPARSNEFQQLIRDIERQLNTTARVTESLMLADATGDVREIDVAIEFTSGTHAVRIAVECRDHARRADVTWIEQLRGKYETMDVDKIVAVSRGGFTKGAIVKARTYHIRALSLEDAEHEDWGEMRRAASVTVMLQRQIVRRVDVTFADGTVVLDIEGPRLDECIVQPPGGAGRTMQQVLNATLRDKTILEKALQALKAGGGTTGIRFEFAGWDLLQPDGTVRALDHAALLVQNVVTEEATIKLQRARYGGADVRFGEAEFSETRVKAVMARPAGQQHEPPLHLTFERRGK
jgi:hypothetical protein